MSERSHRSTKLCSRRFPADNGIYGQGVSSPFGVRVVKANSTSADYTLSVALASPDATNTWKVNSTTLTTSGQNLGTAYAYASTISHVVYLSVPLNAASGGISRVLNFTATSN